MNDGRPVVAPVAVTDARAVYKRLFQYAKPHWKTFLLGTFGAALFSSTNGGMLWTVKWLLDGARDGKNPDIVWQVPIVLVVMFFVRGVGDYISSYFPASVGRRVIKSIRAELFAKYMHLPMSFFDRSSSAPLMSRLTYNVELVAEAATTSVVNLIRDSLTFVGLIGYVFYLNWRLACIVIVIAPPISWLLRRINLLFRRYSARIQASMGDITRVSKESLDGQRVVKAFNAQDYQIQQFELANERNRHSYMRLIGTKAAGNPVVQIIASLGLAVILFLALREVIRGEFSDSEFLVFLGALIMSSQSLRQMTNGFGPLQQGIAAGASVFEVLDLPDEPAGGARPLERAAGAVEFRDVHFEYAAEKGIVLDGINVTVQPRTTLAIVGKSGSGKSTLVSLLPRFYDPQRGAVLLDGADIREYNVRSLRNQVSIVSQDVVLFNDTIRNNISFGMANVTPEAVTEAARAAYVLEFTESAEFPNGLDTEVGDRGSQLSGGQKQRVAIARALLKNAPILVLDEATSALDTESERRIQEALETLKRDRTTLVIAHRLSTVEHADRIIVMHEGQIIESGTHAELLVRNGSYAALYHLQFSA
ncbi:MAG: lipid A export permease/ATP-binding protein MsbA [Gammaproteobacteria bacterium]